MRDLLLSVGLLALLLVESLGPALTTEGADAGDPDAARLEELAGIRAHEPASSPIFTLFSLLHRESGVPTEVSSAGGPGRTAAPARTSVVNVIDQTPRTKGQQTSRSTQKPPSESFASSHGDTRGRRADSATNMIHRQ